MVPAWEGRFICEACKGVGAPDDAFNSLSQSGGCRYAGAAGAAAGLLGCRSSPSHAGSNDTWECRECRAPVVGPRACGAAKTDAR